MGRIEMQQRRKNSIFAKQPAGKGTEAPDSWSMEATPETPPAASIRGKVVGNTFRADLDLAEIDDRMRPGPAWAARSQLLSRSEMVVLSRRMSYVGRQILIWVHLIDSRPTPLMGRVTECDYYADGAYRIVLFFVPVPDSDAVIAWFHHSGGNAH